MPTGNARATDLRGRSATGDKRRPKRVRGGVFDLAAIAGALALVGLGLANLYVVDGPALAMRQAMFALAGLVMVILFWRFRVRMLTVLGWVCYSVATFLLLAVPEVGISANGATRWIAFGPFSFQPSELAKLGLLLVLAWVLGSSWPPWRRFALSLLLAAIPIGLTVNQPDLSTATLLTVLTVAMLILGRVPARFLLPLFGAAAAAIPLVIGLLRPYQVERLGSFLAGSHQEPSGAGWTVQ